MTMDKTQVYLNNFFDYDKWVATYDPQSQEAMDQVSANSPVKTKSSLGVGRLQR